MASPILHVGMVMLAEEKYVKPSGLSDEEKADARRTLDRLARGVHEKKISETELEQVGAPITVTKPDGSTELKETVTDEELRAFLKLARDKADEHEVPDEPFDVNIAEELEKAIDSALEQKQ